MTRRSRRGDGNPAQQAFRALKLTLLLLLSPVRATMPSIRAFSREDLGCDSESSNNSLGNSRRFCIHNERQQAISAIFMRIRRYRYLLRISNPFNIHLKSTFRDTIPMHFFLNIIRIIKKKEIFPLQFYSFIFIDLSPKNY